MEGGSRVSGRVLVTGASGFVGSRTLAPLLRAGFEVHATARVPIRGREDVRWWKADLLDAGQTRGVLLRVRPSHVLHCAWAVDHGRYWSSDENLDWVGATLHLARAAAEAGVGRFVGVGTCAEYDWSDGGAAPRTESDTLAPGTLYGESKAAAFRVLSRFWEGAGSSFAWARLFHLYGPGEHIGRFVPSLLADLSDGRRARVRNGALVRDYLAVDQAGLALAALVSSTCEGAVNVASGRPVSLAELAEHVAEQAGRPGQVELAPPDLPHRETPSVTADIARLTREVGWTPPTGWPGLAPPQLGDAPSPVSTWTDVTRV
jgi:nucleoside-diphosphate-sugar epimerase